MTFKGRKIAYRVEGEGPAVVLIHGFLASQSMWNYFRRKLSAKFKVVTVDLPGHGDSEIIGSVHSMSLMAEVVHELLQKLGIDRMVMVGHSMGGYVALAYARMHTASLRGLVLFHSHAGADTKEAKLNRDRAIQVIRSDRSGFIMNFFPDLFAPENVVRCQKKIQVLKESAEKIKPEAIAAALEGMKIRPDSYDLLREAEFPVLFIAGKKDPRIPVSLVLDQLTLPSRSELCLLDNVGHMGFIESKKETCKVIRHFMLRMS